MAGCPARSLLGKEEVMATLDEYEAANAAEVFGMSDVDLIREVEFHLAACGQEHCLACRMLAMQVEEVARRLEVEGFVSKFRRKS